MYKIRVTLPPNPLTSLRGLSAADVDSARWVYMLCRKQMKLRTEKWYKQKRKSDICLLICSTGISWKINTPPVNPHHANPSKRPPQVRGTGVCRANMEYAREKAGQNVQLTWQQPIPMWSLVTVNVLVFEMSSPVQQCILMYTRRLHRIQN